MALSAAAVTVLVVVAVGLTLTLYMGPTTQNPAGSPTAEPPPLRTETPDSPKLVFNLNLYDVGEGTATLFVDGTSFREYPFTSRPFKSPGSSDARVKGYIKRKLAVPAGTHRYRVRISAGDRRAESEERTLTLKDGSTTELRLTFQGKTGAFTWD